MNSENYVHFLENDLPNLLANANVDIDRDHIWWQQDGAPPHYARISRHVINRLFGNRWIGRLGQDDRAIPWPPRSPDLTPLDYYLWGHVKALVYNHQINDREQLRARILEAFDEVKRQPQMIQHAVDSVRGRCHQIIRNNGRHIENLIL